MLFALHLDLLTALQLSRRSLEAAATADDRENHNNATVLLVHIHILQDPRLHTNDCVATASDT